MKKLYVYFGLNECRYGNRHPAGWIGTRKPRNRTGWWRGDCDYGRTLCAERAQVIAKKFGVQPGECIRLALIDPRDLK